MNLSKFVLVVEDEDEIRGMIVESLKAESGDMSITVVEAKDGREAIQFASRQEFHCVVTDLQMPRTSGQDLIKTLLSDSMNANTPTLVVSAQIDEEFLVNFRSARAIPKPFDPHQLAQMIIREIKLGRMDERVPVHLLNPFVESVRAMLTEDMQIANNVIHMQSPKVRKGLEKWDGDIHTVVTLTTGMSQARIGITFDRDYLIRMKNSYFASRRTQWSSMTLELTARQTASAVVERMMGPLTAIFGQPPRIAEITVSDLRDELKACEASRSSGISIGMKTDQGRVFVSALSPMKAKRIAA